MLAGRMAQLCKLLRIACSGDLNWMRALPSGTAVAIEHVSVLKQINCQTVVDIGANRGQFALAVRHRFPKARIISFEPLAKPASIFERVFSKDSFTTLHRSAIGPRNANAAIHVSGRDDSSSLLAITSLQNDMYPGTAEISVEPCAVAPLNDFLTSDDIGPQALLKLDVQGFELPALEACLPLLDQFAYVYVECSFVEFYAGQAMADEIVAWLREHSLALCGVYNLSFSETGAPLQADFMFRRNGSDDKVRL